MYNRLTTSVHHKPTHTDCYILFHSHLHQRTVTGVLRCMRDRANRICNPTSKQKEFQHLQTVFQANGFPAELVRKTLSHQTHLTPKKRKAKHPIRGKSFQTHEDTEADPDEGQELHPGRKVVYEVPCKECHLFHIGHLESKNGPYSSKWPSRTCGEGGSAAAYNIMAESFRST